MNTLAPLYILLAMLLPTVVLLKIGVNVLAVEGKDLMFPADLVLGVPGFVPLKNGKAAEPKPEDGAS